MENREYDYQTDVEYSPTYLAAISELEAICDASDSCADPPPTNKLQIKVSMIFILDIYIYKT